MKTGKITAKLRDAVPVCLMVNGEEVKRYKNIALPKVLPKIHPMKDLQIVKKSLAFWDFFFLFSYELATTKLNISATRLLVHHPLSSLSHNSAIHPV